MRWAVFFVVALAAYAIDSDASPLSVLAVVVIASGAVLAIATIDRR